MAAIGVRSSCDASATNRRSRCSESRSRRSEASRALKADSMRVSITFRVRARRPTSVVSFSPGTRSVRLPAAMDSAVRSMSRSGRSPIRTSHRPPSRATTTAAPVTISSTRSRWWRVLSMSPSGWATMSTSPLVRVQARTRNGGPPGLVDGAVKYVSWGVARSSTAR